MQQANTYFHLSPLLNRTWRREIYKSSYIFKIKGITNTIFKSSKVQRDTIINNETKFKFMKILSLKLFLTAKLQKILTTDAQIKRRITLYRKYFVAQFSVTGICPFHLQVHAWIGRRTECGSVRPLSYSTGHNVFLCLFYTFGTL
jgi:hypothetical protein